MRRKIVINTLFVGLCILLFTSQSLDTGNMRDDPDAENWDIAVLDTAAEVDYLSPAEKDVILEMNKARSDPKKYAELYIRPRFQWFGGPFGDRGYLVPGNTVYTMSQEGRAGVQSCINNLSGRQGMRPLQPSPGLSRAAGDHVKDTGPKGLTGHTGSDRSTMDRRISRYGKWDKGAGENISYGYNTGRDIVIQLLIDDGVSNRGHRDNILNKNFQYTGAAIGDHSKYTSMCVIDYANEYTSN
jgi:hypothetical protein